MTHSIRQVRERIQAILDNLKQDQLPNELASCEQKALLKYRYDLAHNNNRYNNGAFNEAEF